MIRLGLRLTLHGGREAIIRLVLTAFAVALGVGMLLVTLSCINAVNSQNGRFAWLNTSAGPAVQTPTHGETHPDPAWWLLSADEFDGKLIGRIDVAPTGPHPPVPPGIPALPAPGEFYASPALTDLLARTPSAELGARFPGRQIGTIGDGGLPAPDSLVLVIGRHVDDLKGIDDAKPVTRISTTNPSSCAGATCYAIGIDANGIDLILAVTAAALLFPVLIFIGTASRLAAARREQRFAAMRLVGATPRQVSLVSAVESTVAAVTGVATGFALFFLFRPALASIPFTGARFFISDLRLNLADVVLVAVGVPIAAAVAARLALRRVQISPLGVTRRTTPRPPRSTRLIPVVIGLGELVYFVLAGRPRTTPGQIAAALPGIIMIMAGLVYAGPWLTMVGARFLARRTSRPDVLIAGRRLADDPRAGFRAISGLVLALFVTTVSIGIITTMQSYDDPPNGPTAAATLVEDFTTFTNGGATNVAAVPASLDQELRAIPGVRGLATLRDDGSEAVARRYFEAPHPHGPPPPEPTVLVRCTELADAPAFGRCQDGAAVAVLPRFLQDTSTEDTTWPASSRTVDDVASLPVSSLVVTTDSTTAAIERARSALELAYPYRFTPATIAESRAQRADTKLSSQYRRLADVVILSTMVIAGCSLAVSVAAGLNDRKRPFSLLRLAGTPLGVLRWVVAFEGAAPLVILAFISIAMGMLSAGLFLRFQLEEHLRAPGADYYVIVVAGLVASLATVAATLPLLQRISGPEAARND